VQTHATQTEQVGCSLAAGGWRPVSALTRVFPGRRPSVNAGPDLEIQKFWSCNAPAPTGASTVSSKSGCGVWAFPNDHPSPTSMRARLV